MFDALSDRLSGVFRSLRGRGRITEENVAEAMREIRTVLLEADVNLRGRPMVLRSGAGKSDRR